MKGCGMRDAQDRPLPLLSCEELACGRFCELAGASGQEDWPGVACRITVIINNNTRIKESLPARLCWLNMRGWDEWSSCVAVVWGSGDVSVVVSWVVEAGWWWW